MEMESGMIYKVPYEAAILVLYTKKIAIYYTSEPLKPITYTFNRQMDALNAYEYCMDLMEYIERKRDTFKNIEEAHRQGFKLYLAD